MSPSSGFLSMIVIGNSRLCLILVGYVEVTLMMVISRSKWDKYNQVINHGY